MFCIVCVIKIKLKGFAFLKSEIVVIFRFLIVEHKSF